MNVHVLPPAQEFGQVAVLLGGWAAEKEVSRNSGMAVLNALTAYGIDATAIDLKDVKVGKKLQELTQFDAVFNCVHGRGGEDGQLQALLDFYEIPYTGSGVTACAVAMDKILTKRVWQSVGIATPEFAVVQGNASAEDIDAMIANLGFPMIIKPAQEGSSIGMHRAENEAELKTAIADAAQYDATVLVERWMQGSEYTVAILNGEALPAIELKTTQSFYDYEAKYQRNDTEYLCPTGLGEAKEKQMQALAVKAFHAIGCKTWARVDVMTDEAGVFKLLEINTVPGMTSHSLVPMAAQAAGIDFQTVVVAILAASMNLTVHLNKWSGRTPDNEGGADEAE